MVEDPGYTTVQVARELGINQNLLRTWRKKYGKGNDSSGFSKDEQEGLYRLRKEVGRLRMERKILKKRRPSSRRKTTEVSVLFTAPRRVDDPIGV